MIIYDFSFNDIKLSEKNGYITSNNDEINQLVPSYTIVTHTVPNVGEEKFIKKVKNPYEFRMELFFKEISSVTEIKNWLDVSTPKKFKFIPDLCGVGEIYVNLVDSLIPEIYEENGKYNVLVTVKFKEFVV